MYFNSNHLDHSVEKSSELKIGNFKATMILGYICCVFRKKESNSQVLVTSMCHHQYSQKDITEMVLMGATE